MLIDLKSSPLIGYSCREESTSTSLWLMDSLYEALAFNFSIFVYNKNLLSYKLDRSPRSYLFDKNLLLFENLGSPSSTYKDDLYSLIYGCWSDYFGSRIQLLKSADVVDPTFCSEACEDGILSVLIDPFVIKDIYAIFSKKFSKTKRSLRHYINIVYVNSLGLCRVIDAHYGINHVFPFEKIIQAISAVSDGTPFLLKRSKSNWTIEELIRFNLDFALSDRIFLGDSEYYSNGKAVENFIDDFKDIVGELENSVGEFASQFISYPLIEFRHMIDSNFRLYRHLVQKKEISYLSDLVDLFWKNSIVWKNFDRMLDLYYLKGKSITQNNMEFEALLRQAAFTSCLIRDECNKIIHKI